MTGVSIWLDSAFYSFDKAILSFWHGVAEWGRGFFTPLANIISAFSYKGLFLIFLGVIMLLFKKTRKIAVTELLALLINLIVCNLILKVVIARARPYTVPEYISWWQMVGANTESDYSFPSGHTAIMSSAMFAIFFAGKNKKWLLLCLFPILLMGSARNYLMVHYATDVIAGVIVGAVSATISYFSVKGIYKLIQKNNQVKFCNFALNADLINFINTRRKAKKENQDE